MIFLLNLKYNKKNNKIKLNKNIIIITIYTININFSEFNIIILFSSFSFNIFKDWCKSIAMTTPISIAFINIIIIYLI